MHHETTPVLIAGGGLVGLSTALFLAQHGVRALVLEKHEGTALHPRARGFHASTLELLEPTGVADAVAQLGLSFQPKRGGVLTAESLSGPVHGFMPFDAQGMGATLSPRRGVALGQDRLEPLIRDTARALGADIRFAHELLGFTQGADHVEVEVRARESGERYRVSSRYLVAADGARSATREALGIARTGHGSLGHVISCLFEADLSGFQREHPFFLAQITHPEAAGTLVGTDRPNRWIYGTAFDPTRESIDEYTEARWVARIRRVAGDPTLALATRGTFVWESAERVAARFRDGRVFLVGDSAHQMPPAGAHGANTGIQDAANLAWKLASVVMGQAGEGLLDSYDEERRPVAEATARQARLLAQRLRYVGTASESDDELCEDAAVIFGARYDGEPALPRRFEPTGQPGTRAPHVWLSAGAERRSTRSLFGRGWVLLSAERSWLEVGEETARAFRVPLATIEADGFQRAYGVAPHGAVLVRPDGYVGARWPMRERAPGSVLASALRMLLHRAE